MRRFRKRMDTVGIAEFADYESFLEAEPRERHQDREPRPERDLGRPGLRGEPCLCALAFIQVAVGGDDVRARKALAHQPFELGPVAAVAFGALTPVVTGEPIVDSDAFATAVILGITTLALALSFVRRVREQPGTYVTGQYLFLVFAVAIGSRSTTTTSPARSGPCSEVASAPSSWTGPRPCTRCTRTTA